MSNWLRALSDAGTTFWLLLLRCRGFEGSRLQLTVSGQTAYSKPLYLVAQAIDFAEAHSLSGHCHTLARLAVQRRSSPRVAGSHLGGGCPPATRLPELLLLRVSEACKGV